MLSHGTWHIKTDRPVKTVLCLSHTGRSAMSGPRFNFLVDSLGWVLLRRVWVSFRQGNYCALRKLPDALKSCKFQPSRCHITPTCTSLVSKSPTSDRHLLVSSFFMQNARWMNWLPGSHVCRLCPTGYVSSRDRGSNTWSVSFWDV